MKGEENQLVGKLEGVDDYMNLYLTNAMECRGEEKVRSLGEIVLRGNNVVLSVILKETNRATTRLKTKKNPIIYIACFSRPVLTTGDISSTATQSEISVKKET